MAEDCGAIDCGVVDSETVEIVKENRKRSLEDVPDGLADVKAILLDIEGTTTPITFVKDKLFPYVRENLKTYLENHWESDECHDDIKALKDQVTKDKEDAIEGVVEILDGEDEKDKVIESILANVIWQMNDDRKTTALKQLQGHVWRDAYKTGKIKGEVYNDVLEALKNWQACDKQVYIYSSGSVEAQKLLFTYSEHGDLSQYLSGYFDTTVGGKMDKTSYAHIAEKIGVEAEQIHFLTDISKEARAAISAGMHVTVVSREGNAPLSEEEQKELLVVTSFDQLEGEDKDGETPAKK